MALSLANRWIWSFLVTKLLIPLHISSIITQQIGFKINPFLNTSVDSAHQFHKITSKEQMNILLVSACGNPPEISTEPHDKGQGSIHLWSYIPMIHPTSSTLDKSPVDCHGQSDSIWPPRTSSVLNASTPVLPSPCSRYHPCLHPFCHLWHGRIHCTAQLHSRILSESVTGERLALAAAADGGNHIIIKGEFRCEDSGIGKVSLILDALYFC